MSEMMIRGGNGKLKGRRNRRPSKRRWASNWADFKLENVWLGLQYPKTPFKLRGAMESIALTLRPL